MADMRVRCCCDAHLIGFLTIDPRVELKVGDVLRMQAGDTMLAFDVALVQWSEGPVLRHAALRSRDYPIDLLRQIQGFREATEEDHALENIVIARAIAAPWN